MNRTEVERELIIKKLEEVENNLLNDAIKQNDSDIKSKMFEYSQALTEIKYIYGLSDEEFFDYYAKVKGLNDEKRK